MKCHTSLCLLLAALLAASEGTTGPVGKVVNLLSDLKEKIDKDADADEKDYKDHECWCKQVEASKEEMITEETQMIAEKEQEIATGESEDNKLDNAILVQTEEIKDNKDGQGQATQVRSKQHEASAAETNDNKDMIENIGEGATAVKALEGSSSQMVLDQLTTMGHKVELDEDKNNKTETQATNSYTVLITDMNQSLALLEKEKIDTTVAEGQTEMEIAEDIEVKVDTQEQLKADTAFLAEATSSCQTRKQEYLDRTTLRTTEMDGINQALEILDKQRELLSNTFKDVKISFIQLDHGLNSEALMAAQSAFSVLKAKASATRSLRLGLVAAKLRRAMPEGAFTTVLAEIEKMMNKMKLEAARDVKEKDSCTTDYFEIAKKTKQLAFLTQRSATQMEKLEDRIAKLEDEKKAAEQEIVATDADLNQSLTLRTEENNAFKAAKADDEQAIAVLTETSEAMKKYYEDRAAKQAALVQYDPEALSDKRKQLKRSENKYDLTDELSQENAAGAILDMIDHIIGNLKKEITEALEEEKQGQLDYEKSRDLLLVSKEKLNKKKTSLASIIAKANEGHSSADDSKTRAESDMADQAATKASIKDKCDYILSKFDDRASDRESEMDGLMQAKALLSGSSLVQKDVRAHDKTSAEDVNDEKSTLMNYLGLA